MKAKLDHIGIAVADLPRVKRLFEILGREREDQERVEEQGVQTHFIPVRDSEPQVELLEPIDSAGAVAKFLSKKGSGGVHHLAFRVEKGSLDELCQKLQEEGYRCIYDSPQEGAHGMRINFLHPKTTDGLLIELMEPGA